MNFLIVSLIVCQGLYFVPQYESDQICLINQPAGTSINTVTFSSTFQDVPQVIFSIQRMDKDGGIGNYSITASLITQSTLITTINSSQILNRFCYSWMAFVDDNVFGQVGQVTQRMTAGQTIHLYISFAKPLSYQPKAAFFLNGVSQSITPSSDTFQYRFSYVAVTQTYIFVVIVVSGGYEISWFSYSIIYGSNQYLQTGLQQITTFGSVPFTLFPQDSRTKLSQVSITAIVGSNNIRIEVFNSQGSITAYTYSSTLLDQIVLIYFKYLPCPIYCTTCYTSVPNCDACVSTTNRVGSNCTSCLAHMFLIVGEMNCRECGPYCDSCSGSATNCIACLPSTQRINPSSCTSCPTQMFAQQGVDNCQCNFYNNKECVNYCNQCSSQADNCTVCLPSSLRSHPPNCATCPAQYFVVQGMQNCQQCPTQCNNCQNYTSFCIACNTGLLRINPPDCMDCPQYTYVNGDTCTECDSTCQTCNSQKCLACLSNQYIDALGRCINCPRHCLTCDINTCQTCDGNCSVCNFTSCIKCISDNYYISGTYCNKCPLHCQTCDGQQCFNCISPLMTPNNGCQCQYPCLECDNNKCLTCISPDYRISGENCQYCPSQCAACDTDGKCFKEPQNCKLANIQNNLLIQCIQCQANFYLANNFCIQCSSNCLECADQPENCTSCRFPSPNQSDCQLCEAQDGLYSNYQTNSCYAICGDGIVNGNEECDDGNISSSDGCTHCKIDSGYQCIGLVCQFIIYPIPIIYQNTYADTFYTSNKQFEILYNVPIKTQTLNIHIQIATFIEFTYNLTFINNQQFLLIINLQEQLNETQIQMIFVNGSQIISENGVQQQVNMIESEITGYIRSTETEQDISDATNTTMGYLLIILAVLIGLSILFGGLDIFWNLLDLLQTMSYLKYINTVKPQFLDTFFNLFGFLQFQNLPLNQLINTTSTIINIIPILNVMITSVFLYYFAQIIFKLIEPNIFIVYPEIYNFKVLKYFYNVKFYLLQLSDCIINQFFFSGIIRLFISSTYELSFMICLGIYGLQVNNSSAMLNGDLSLTFLAAFAYLCITLILSTIASSKSISIKLKQDQYGAICEGLKFKDPYTKQYNNLLLIKRLAFMMSLVLLYNEPIFQICNIVLIQVSQVLYLVIIDPITNYHEKQKQILCESFMLIAEIQLAILVIDDYYTLFIYEHRRIFGWICVFSLVIIIVAQLCLDAHQQLLRYYNQYPHLKKIVQIFKTYENKPIIRNSIHNLMI